MIGVGLASLIISSLLAITSIYGIIFFGATSVREAGQGRNPAALSECELCALFCFAKTNIKSEMKYRNSLAGVGIMLFNSYSRVRIIVCY